MDRELQIMNVASAAAEHAAECLALAMIAEIIKAPGKLDDEESWDTYKVYEVRYFGLPDRISVGLKLLQRQANTPHVFGARFALKRGDNSVTIWSATGVDSDVHIRFCIENGNPPTWPLPDFEALRKALEDSLLTDAEDRVRSIEADLARAKADVERIKNAQLA